MPDDEDPLVTIPDAVHLPSEVHPTLVYRDAVLRSRALPTVGDGFDRGPHRDYLGVFGQERVKARSVPSVEGVKRTPHELNVLLRNNASPRLQRWLERNALPEPFELTHQTPG